VEIRIRCADGVRPIRVLGREARIDGQEIVTTLNQLYANQEKYLMVEVEIPGSKSGAHREVAFVKASYANTVSKRREDLSGSAVVTYSDSDREVEEKRNKDVMVSSIELVATEKNRKAVELRDKGRKAEAKKLLRMNADILKSKAREYNAPALGALGRANQEDMDSLDDDASWGVQRKAMRKRQYKVETQQAW